jgi:hypothetical protein
LDSNLNGTLAFFSAREEVTRKNESRLFRTRAKKCARFCARRRVKKSLSRELRDFFPSRALKIKSRFLCEFYIAERAREFCAVFFCVCADVQIRVTVFCLVLLRPPAGFFPCERMSFAISKKKILVDLAREMNRRNTSYGGMLIKCAFC